MINSLNDLREFKALQPIEQIRANAVWRNVTNKSKGNAIKLCATIDTQQKVEDQMSGALQSDAAIGQYGHRLEGEELGREIRYFLKSSGENQITFGKTIREIVEKIYNQLMKVFEPPAPPVAEKKSDPLPQSSVHAQPAVNIDYLQEELTMLTEERMKLDEQLKGHLDYFHHMLKSPDMGQVLPSIEMLEKREQLEAKKGNQEEMAELEGKYQQECEGFKAQEILKRAEDIINGFEIDKKRKEWCDTELFLDGAKLMNSSDLPELERKFKTLNAELGEHEEQVSKLKAAQQLYHKIASLDAQIDSVKTELKDNRVQAHD